MNNISKRILIICAAVLMTAACIIGGLFVSGNLEKAVSKLSGDEISVTEELSEPVTEAVGEKSVRPDVLRGTKLSVKADGEYSLEAVSALIDGIVQNGFNSVLITSGDSKGYFTVEDISARKASISECVDYAKSKGLYTVIYIQSPPDFGADDVSSYNKSLFSAISGLHTDSLVLSDMYMALKQENIDAAEAALKEIKAYTDKNTVIGEISVEMPFGAMNSDDKENFVESLGRIVADGCADNVFTEPQIASDNDDLDFSDCVSLWKKFADEKVCKLTIAQSSRFLEDKDGLEKIKEILTQISAIYKADEEFTISLITCDYEQFCNDELALKILKGTTVDNVLPDNYLKTLKITNHSKTSFTTTESKVSFTGECNPLYKLTCNSNQVEYTEDGYFSAEYSLKVGTTSFTFEQNGEKVTYKVTYNIDVLRDVSPTGSLKTPGGGAVEITATALRDSKVYATVNGKSVTLNATNALMSDSDDVSMDTSSDYVTFIGTYTLPAGTAYDKNLGNIVVYASYSGLSESIKGASITVTADETIKNLPVITYTPPKTTTTTTTTTKPTTTEKESEIYETETDSEGNIITVTENHENESTSATESVTTTTQGSTTSILSTLPAMCTPYTYNGVSGTSRMCVVATPYTETMPLTPLNDLSVPLTTPLLKGTFDFIVGESSYTSGSTTYTYYNLGSGRRVYRKDVTVIEKAYGMPANSMTVVSSGTNSKSTYMNLYVSWKIPFNAILNGQKYVNDPKNSREYAVTSLGATSLDITFYYTVSLNGKIDVSDSSVIKSYDWIKSKTGQTCTLRLYLKNAAKFYGYSVSYNSDGTLNISVKENNSSSVSGHTIMLDPGHGGTDGGASCSVNSSSYNEAKINLSIAQKIKAKLEALGAKVIMTRSANTSVSLVERKNLARSKNPDIFLSIHCDSAYSSGAYGTSAYYYKPYSYALAKNVHSNIVSTYKNTIYKENLSLIDRGTVFYPYSVTRIEECPSVLVEYGYISNVSECKILQSSSYQNSLAEATVKGITQYFANS